MLVIRQLSRLAQSKTEGPWKTTINALKLSKSGDTFCLDKTNSDEVPQDKAAIHQLTFGQLVTAPLLHALLSSLFHKQTYIHHCCPLCFDQSRLSDTAFSKIDNHRHCRIY